MRAERPRRARRPSPLLFIMIAAAALLLAIGAAEFLGGPEPAALPAAAMDEGWALVLVNRDHAVPEDWDPELLALTNGCLVDERIYPALQAMFDDMRAQGVYPVVRDGWRSAQAQQELLDDKAAQFRAAGYSSSSALALAQTWVALPGTSEHQLGLAVDINADTTMSTGEQVYGWLSEHAHEYGFIHRYPPDKTELTGISSEPWHYRYVGIEAAEDMVEQGLCLEEYIAQLTA